MLDIDIRRATESDWAAIARLLQASELPLDGAREHLDTFVVARRGSDIVGTAALELYGDIALLRSVAVAGAERGRGIARGMVDALAELAAQRKVSRLFLLTTTAVEYFGRLGFHTEARSSAPAALRASAEFRGACPASATFMVRPVSAGAAAANARIRSAAPDDAEAIAGIYAPIVTHTHISFEWQPPTVDDFRARITKVSAKYPWLVALDDAGTVAAFVYANTHRDPPSYQWSVNTSVFVREDSRGKGFGKALYRELFVQLATLGYFRAYAGIALPNAASVALHESVGFRPLGVYEKVGFKFAAWHDVGWWQCEVQPPVLNPAPPRTPA